MYVLINKNSYDLHQCAPFAVCFSDDKSKLEEEIKRTINIIEKFDKDKEDRKVLLRQYLEEQLNKNKEKLVSIHNSIWETKNEYYTPSFEESWEDFVYLIVNNTLNQKDFEYAIDYFGDIIKFPEHIGELEEPKEYLYFIDDLYISECHEYSTLTQKG